MFRPRPRLVAAVGVLMVVAGCSTGGGSTATSGAGVSGAPSVSQAVPSQPAATQAGPSQPAAGGGGGSLPGDPCQLVTAEDVASVYGGDVGELGLDEGYCRFEIEGDAYAGKSVAAGEFSVSFGDEWSTYEDAKVVFGDAVVKIDGLGTEAYSAGGFIHAKVGAGEIVVGGVWVGDYDRSALDQETFDMTKLLLSRL